MGFGLSKAIIPRAEDFSCFSRLESLDLCRKNELFENPLQTGNVVTLAAPVVMSNITT